MIKTIAVGTDGSPTAGKALAAAFELAERYEAKLVVLSAFDGSSSGEWASGAAEQADRVLAIAEE